MPKTKYFIIYYIFPILLFIFGIFTLLNFIKASEFGILNLDVRGNPGMIVATRSGDLIKGDIVWGKFHSEFTNLGIVSVRFFNEDRDSKDTLIFRIRQQGSKDWYYEAKYETDQFLPHRLFPFGFPTIGESADRDYEFQLESVRGATGSGILIDKEPPVFIAKSTYTKANLEKDPGLRNYFLKNKLYNVSGDPELLFNLILCFLPLLLFLIYLYSDGVSYQYLTVISILLILFDIFAVEKNYDLYLLSLMFFWSLTCKKYLFEYRISLVFSMAYFAIMTLALLFGQEGLPEKASAWGYLFLLFSVIQYFYELFKGSGVLSLGSFFRNFHKFDTPKNYWLRKLPSRCMWLLDIVSWTIFLPVILISHELGHYWRKKFTKFLLEVILLSPAILLFASPVRKAVWVFPKFIPFYPEDYIWRFINSIIIPLVVLLSFTTVIFILSTKMTKKSKFVLIAIAVLFNLISGKMISNAVRFENHPTIFSVSPSRTSEAWTDVVITGKNFRDLPFVGKLYIGDVEQGEYMIYWSDEKVIFRTTPDLTRSGFVKIVPLDREPSNMFLFEYNFKY